MNSSTTLLAKIIVTSAAAVDKHQPEELSENPNYFLNIFFDSEYVYYYIAFGIIFDILFIFMLWRICCRKQQYGQSTSSPPTPPPLPTDEFFQKRDYGNFNKISVISPDLSINEIHDE